ARGYDPGAYIERSPRLRAAIALIEDGFFSPDDPGRFRPITADLRRDDRYLHCADFDSYAAAHADIERGYRDQADWTGRVVHNIARVGRFSSDRTIREYAEEIWRIQPVEVPPE